MYKDCFDEKFKDNVLSTINKRGVATYGYNENNEMVDYRENYNNPKKNCRDLVKILFLEVSNYVSPFDNKTSKGENPSIYDVSWRPFRGLRPKPALY
jgi:hypothetical protein